MMLMYIFRNDHSYFNKMHNNSAINHAQYKQSHLLPNMQKIGHYNFV